MTWSSGGLVQATDFNTLVGGNPTTTANTLNATWATGGGQAGYGQTAVANVSAGGTISATPWNQLFYNTSQAASHQGTSISSISNVSASSTVTYYAAAQTNLNSIYASRGNAASQGSTTANTVTTASTWTASATFTHTITFANNDAARYFFNAGGQIKMTASHSNTTAGVNNALATLCTATGTVVMSGQNSGSRTIAGTSYNGITKIGGSSTSGNGVATNNGYFAMTTANAELFDQNTGTSPYTTLMDLRYIGNSNASPGGTLRIFTLIQETGANGTVGTGTAITCTVVPPSTTYIANSWGAITVSGSVTVS